VANNSTLAAAFSTVVPLVAGAVNVNVSGYSMNPYSDQLFAAPSNAAPSSNFYNTNRFHFYATLNGMTGAQVWAALQTDPSAAVVDQNYDPAPGAIGAGPTAAHPLVHPGDAVKLSRPGSTAQTSVKVLGVLSESVINGVWINPQTAAVAGYLNETVYFFTVRSGVSHTLADTEAKTAFFSAGLVLFDIGSLLATAIAGEEGVITLLEIFVGLGLAVGIAAMGIVALRAVVERRREIGMLRAEGFTQGMVLRAFVLEYSFVTVLGLAIGASLGVLIVYNLALSPNAAASGIVTFSIPWFNIGIVLAAAYGLAMAAIAGPSWKASRVPPAEAVRSTD
ncbi:MAG: FtsX-like permease family protein, partial [Thermoplasmata archaeon]|nr:FtsX-like permease family protein [Thermoplasmata archaeon]